MSPSYAQPDSRVFRADVGDFYGPITNAPVSSIRDVILCPTIHGRGDVNEYQVHPPIGSPVLRRLQEVDPGPAPLGRHMRIDRLDGQEADMVLAACTPRGHHFAPIKQFGQRYCFIRDVDVAGSDTHRYDWDREGVLYDALAMSRLLRDHAFSLEYAARIITHSDGEQIVAWQPDSARAYSIRQERDWLTYGEATELKALLATYWDAKVSLPARVTRAMWRAEYASSIGWADVILPVLVSGLEALLKTERGFATKQFKCRATALAEELGIDGVTEPWAANIYDARSDWVHGASVKLFALDPDLSGGPTNPQESEAFQDLARVQDLLHAAVRRAVEDESFRARFESDVTVQRHWPVARPR